MPSVLITGANRSLELAFTKAHLARGWTVRATDRGIADGPLAAGATALSVDTRGLAPGVVVVRAQT